MIRLVVARHEKDKDIYKNYIGASITELDLESHEVWDDVGLAQKYNIGINSLINSGLETEDIICFVHSDVIILDSLFEQKIELAFQTDSKLGLLGVIGCKEFTENGMWWANNPSKLCGHIMQENDGMTYHLQKGTVGFHKNVVTVDGLMIMIKGDLLLKGIRFDERFDKFHFYDQDICFQTLENGYKVGVADILVQHFSPGIGSKTNEWENEKDKFFKKWKEKGISFPYNV